jgi:hypothetical protein
MIHKTIYEIAKYYYLNCMVICSANSGQTKIDHLKLRAKLVQTLLIDMEVKVSGNFKAIIPR